uniref:Uncharacterized protein n=1 Tax=Arundo donax TaxID=35708 RepID=A0A0A9EXZ1_ARUDO
MHLNISRSNTFTYAYEHINNLRLDAVLEHLTHQSNHVPNIKLAAVLELDAH